MRNIGLFSLLLLAACSKGPPSSSPAIEATATNAHTLVHIESTPSLRAALAIANQSLLTCADPAQCPKAVGMLLAADSAGGFLPGSDSIAACTSVLVGDDLVLTNSHCVPAAVKLLPDLCRERMRVAFAGDENAPPETIPCGQLIGFSKRETPMSPDLALLRLSRKTGRAPFPTALSGVEPESLLRSFRVNPSLKERSGSLVSSVCRAVAGSFRMPVYGKTLDPVNVFGDCNAIPGNSGSPLLDASGHLVSLLQASLPLSPASALEWGKHSDEAFAPLSMGTSLHCLITDPASGSFAWNEECATVADEDVIAARSTIRSFLDQEPLAQETAAALAPFLGQSDKVRLVRQAISSSALDRRETLQPACAIGPSDESISLQLPELLLSLRFNRYLQLTEPRVSVESVAAARYELSAQGTMLAAEQSEPAPFPLCN